MPPTSATVHPTSIVHEGARLGAGVRVGPFCVIHDGVELGDGSFVDAHSVLGAPSADYYDDPAGYSPRRCTVGAGSIIRSHTIVYAGATLGAHFESGHHVTVREGSRIGSSVRVGTRSDLQGNLEIGDHSRLHSNVFVAQGTTVEDLVWLLPNVTLANDPHPPSDSCTRGPTVRRFAVVSAGATVFPGVDIGEGAVVGAGSLVRENVPAHSVAYGVPARVVGATGDIVCREGRLAEVYPWWTHFRRGYPDGVLPSPGDVSERA